MAPPAPGPARRLAPFLLPPALFLGAMALLRLLLFPAGGGDGGGDPAPVASLLGGEGGDGGYERVLAPRPFRFPADHGAHPAFRHEWWYFTGNLDGEGGRRFGYQLTFFRFALAPPGGERRTSALASREAWMAHLAVTDPAGRRFLRSERISRGGVLAGAEPPGGVPPGAAATGQPAAVRVRLDDWSAAAGPGAASPWRLRAFEGDFGVDLVLSPAGPPVPQGDRGVSRKGEGEGNASLYYSFPRMATAGVVRAGGRDHAVRGSSWMDREWGTSSLPPTVEGWDWFALHLSDGRDLMFYRLRERGTGAATRYSAGSLVSPGGALQPLAAADVSVAVRGRWRSPATGVEYPAGWDLSLPGTGLSLRVTPVLADQEWDGAVRYWEGAVDAEGSGPGGPLSGRGYVELAGYGGEGAPRGR